MISSDHIKKTVLLQRRVKIINNPNLSITVSIHIPNKFFFVILASEPSAASKREKINKNNNVRNLLKKSSFKIKIDPIKTKKNS